LATRTEKQARQAHHAELELILENPAIFSRLSQAIVGIFIRPETVSVRERRRCKATTMLIILAYINELSTQQMRRFRAPRRAAGESPPPQLNNYFLRNYNHLV
jgi:hypothetical protein